MGMFDTIHFKEPLPCPVCGTGIPSLQTKDFDSILADYHIGSLLPSAIHKGILKDTLWCDACFREKRAQEPQMEVFLVIWHSVLAGVETSLERAEQRLATTDRLDLLGWLNEAQREALHWQRRFRSLNRDVTRWHEHLAETARAAAELKSEPEDEAVNLRKSRLSFFSLPDEILNSPDPLGAILERHNAEAAGES